jgi:hypothetical protein
LSKRLGVLFAVIAQLAISIGCNSAPQTQTQVASPTPSATAESYPRLASQAKELTDALLRKDLDRFLDLTHPKVLQLGGGRENMRATMKKELEQTEAEGVVVLSSSIGTPTQVIHDSGSIYAVMPNTLKVKAQAGTFQTESTLIGVSADNGANWTFVDASGKDDGELKKVLPDVADKLSVPPAKQPVKISN